MNNPEKKIIQKRGKVSKETRGKGTRKRLLDRPPSVFLEITIPEGGDPEIIVWTFHTEGARGSVGTTTLEKRTRDAIVRRILPIIDRHVQEAMAGRARLIRQLRHSDGWADRIRSARLLHEARKLDRERQAEEARGTFQDPLDFDDLDQLVKTLSREERVR